jgi:hypothetical protein
MAWHSLLYFLLLFTSIPYALARGGTPERLAALIMLAAAALTIVALSASVTVYQDAEIGEFEVDLFAFAGFLVLALYADRYWPLLVAGLQGDAVVIHLGKLAQPEILPLGYAIGLSIWSYPILIMLAIGTFRHRRRLARLGGDPAWSSFGRRSGSREERVGLKGAFGAGSSSIRFNRSGRAKALSRTSNGGMG